MKSTEQVCSTRIIRGGQQYTHGSAISEVFRRDLYCSNLILSCSSQTGRYQTIEDVQKSVEWYKISNALKAEEIFLQTVSMWVFQLKFSSIDTPRDFVEFEDTCSRGK